MEQTLLVSRIKRVREAGSNSGASRNEADMTMRAFVLDALKAKGLDVRPDDLIDLRKERR